MKRILNFITVVLFLLSLSGCRSYFELLKPSLILQYYQGPYRWAGIELGDTSKHDIYKTLRNIDEIDRNTFIEGTRFGFVDIALCVDF